jgi:site-specific DNA recombinase
VPDYGVHGRRGDFDALIGDDLFYRVQGVLNGRIRIVAPRERNRPDFPLRGLVRCHACGRGLTASWSKGRNDRFAYYHCRPQCRAINISKTKLEGLFVEELERMQPTPGYGVGGRFQSFTINDLEMVAQICPRWNPLTSWLQEIQFFRTAA